MDALALAGAVASLSFGGSGLALLLRRRALVAATLMLLAGLAGVAASVLVASGRDAVVVSTACGALLAPTALATYPATRWRHPVDFVGVVLVVGCGAVTMAYSDTDVGFDVTGLMVLVQGCVLIAHTWWRIEVSEGAMRRALVWMALAATVTLFVYGLVVFAAEGATGRTLPSAAVALFALVGPAMYVGATLPDLVDVRGLVTTVVVTAVALITVMAVFVLELSLVDALGEGDPNVGATAVMAALAATVYPPTRVALRGVVDQLLFGDRPDPLGAASQVAGRIGDDPVVALRAIRQALVLPYAALEVGDAPALVSGTATTHTRTFDLDGAGTLVVGLRPGDLSFSSGDEQVLRLTVPLLAQTLRARALAAEVLESRGRTIAAVEEERRRLRRELHDGLGPRLSGVAFTSDAVRNLIRSDPAAAEDLVGRLRADTVTAIEEIRRMVYAMRPPALDELGLVPALRQQAQAMRDPAGRPMAVEVTAPDAFPVLPAAVEVAAYRIVVEALANVARHRPGAAAAVRLDPADDGLRLEVTDTGGGHHTGNGTWRPGVGISSMRERAAELGGTLEAGPGPAGGRVAAVLPL